MFPRTPLRKGYPPANLDTSATIRQKTFEQLATAVRGIAHMQTRRKLAFQLRRFCVAHNQAFDSARFLRACTIYTKPQIKKAESIFHTHQAIEEYLFREYWPAICRELGGLES